jgi:hypothetical protein
MKFHRVTKDMVRFVGDATFKSNSDFKSHFVSNRKHNLICVSFRIFKNLFDIFYEFYKIVEKMFPIAFF